MERVVSALPDSKGHDEDQMKTCEKRLTVNYYNILSTHLLPLFDKVYFQVARFTCLVN